MRYRAFFGLILLAITAIIARGNSRFTKSDLARLDSRNEAQWRDTVLTLRAEGSQGLEQLLDLREALLAESPGHEHLANLEKLIDRVGGQRYCSASRLFWHTDLEAAKAAARKSGKPILSLRMMGNLTDEFSCANSRFFRSTLYANAGVSQYLRDHYVLHWKSVRPVPKVTIDFGDGRKLERTLTGNSIHYVLTSDGQVVDALPGLYGPQKFQSLLMEAEGFAHEISAVPDRIERDERLVAYHAARAAQISQDWASDIRQIDPEAAVLKEAEFGPEAKAGDAAPPKAELAARLAVTKSAVEMPLLVGIDATRLEAATDEAMWQAIAALHAEDARLDAASRALIESQNPTAAQAGALTTAKYVVEDPLLRLVRNLENSIAVDAVRNEYLMHRTIHEWFARQEAPADVEALNERVYAELFLTPSADPWIGLAPPDTYTALENNGVVAP